MDEETANALRPSERLGNYFVVIGDRNTEKHPEPLPEHQLQKYITDILIVNPKSDELSYNYELVTKKIGGERLNLKASKFMGGKLFLAVEYNGANSPITGITICNLTSLPENYLPITKTPSGRDASVGTLKKQKMYIAIERNEKTKYFVTALSTFCPGRNEVLPERYRKCGVPLYKSLTYQRLPVYLTYEILDKDDPKSLYKAEVLDRYPKEDYEDSPLIANAANFCLPEGLQVELFDIRRVPMPKWYPFVLTESSGRRIYGASLVFWEAILNKEAKDSVNLSALYKQSSGGNDDTAFMLLHKTKCICIMSHHPFFSPYKKVLQFLYRISLGKNQKMPIERYISHLLGEVTSPKPSCSHIVDWRLGANNKIEFDRPSPFQLPLVDLSFLPLFHMLDAENVAKLLYLFISEKKILLSSVHMPILCYVAEAVRSLMFPLDYQGVYIPMCSHELYAVLEAPVPFVVGMSSNYIKRLLIPTGVWIVDLDNNSMHCSGIENSNNGPYEFLEMNTVKTFVKGLNYYLNDAGVKADGNSAVINAFQSSQEAMLASTLNLSVEGIRNEALKMMVQYLRHYRNHLKVKDGRIRNLSDMFDIEAFVANAVPEHQAFLEEIVPTQTFGAFIQERTFPSNNAPCFVFFDQCLDLSLPNDEDASPVLLEMQIKRRMETGAKNVHPALKRRLSLGLSKDVKVKVFEGPSFENLDDNKSYDYDDYWPNLDTSLYLPESSNVSSYQVIHGNEKIAARTEQELISSLQADKSAWYFTYMNSSSNKSDAAKAKVESLLKHFYGLYGLCLVSALALLNKSDYSEEEEDKNDTEEQKSNTVADNEDEEKMKYYTNKLSIEAQKKRLFKNLNAVWSQIKVGLIILDEAGYRSLLTACSYLGHDGKRLAEEVYMMMKTVQYGKVSALTYSQYTRVRAVSSKPQPKGDDKTSNEACETGTDKNHSKGNNLTDSWLLMWSKQKCTKCEYTYLDEQILNRFEDSGLARTISCPCCGTSIEPKLYFRSYVSSRVVDDLKSTSANVSEKKAGKIASTKTPEKYPTNNNVKVQAESNEEIDNVEKSVTDAVGEATKDSNITDGTSEDVNKNSGDDVVTVDDVQLESGGANNNGNADTFDETAGPLSRSMSMQDKLKIVRSSLIFLDLPDSNDRSRSNTTNSLSHTKSAFSRRSTVETINENIKNNFASASNIFENTHMKERKEISKYRGTISGSGCSDSAVAYLSLIRLRTDMEKVLTIEGHNGFERSRLRLRHQHLFYNLVWYCSRLKLDVPLNLESHGNKSYKMWKEHVQFSFSSYHGKRTIPGYGIDVFSLRSFELKKRKLLITDSPTRRRAQTSGKKLESGRQSGYKTSENEDEDESAALIHFSKDLMHRKNKWIDETMDLMHNGYHEEIITSFLKLRLEPGLVWPEIKNSIYDEMRQMHAKDILLKEKNGVFGSVSELGGMKKVHMPSKVGKPPNKYDDTNSFEVNFDNAINWLSPHYRDEVKTQDTCGCNMSVRLIRHTFGELW